MSKGEELSSAKSANQRRGLHALVLVAALALAACSAGRTNSNSTAAQRELFPTKSGAPAPQGPARAQILLDCKQHPQAWYSTLNLGDDEDPRRVGETLILGTYDETATTPGGKPVVTNGIRVEYRGGHQYLVEPLDGSISSSPISKEIDSTDPNAVAAFAFGGASYAVETLAGAVSATPSSLGIMATITCGDVVHP